MRVLCLIVLAACSIPELDGSDKECPCADGFVCDEARNRCVAIEDAGRDASSDVSVDAPGVDATIPTDVGPGIDVGFDVGGRDVGSGDVGIDDAGTDIGAFDASTGCPAGAFYCIDFDEPHTPYDVVGEIGMRPGYRGQAGFFQSFFSDSYIEVDPIALPSSFHARLWVLRDGSTDFFEPTPIAEFAWGLGTDDRVWLSLRNTGTGNTDYFFGNEDAPGAATSSETAGWVCVQLSVDGGGVSIRVDEAPEATGLIRVRDDWESMAFGILESSLTSPNSLHIDEIAVGPAEIPCDAF